MRSISRMTLSLTLAASFLLDGATVFAQKKGGGGSVPAGTIYYSYYENTGAGYYYGTHRINADGTNAAVVFAFRSVEEPSHALHAGQGWFIDADFHEINVVSENGTHVVLFEDPDIVLLEAPHWQRHTSDGRISFEAEQWGINPQSGQREMLDVGIFMVQVAYDAAGAIVGAVPGSRQLVVSESEFGGSITGHDWGTDGRLLFSVRDAGANSGLWIADLTQPEASRYTWVSTGAARVVSIPAWSPDGSRVGFNENSTGIVILNLANGRRKTIPNSATHGVGTVRWSPNGDGLVYHRGRYGEPQSDIYRADRDGSGRTFIATGSALGWRD